MYTILIELANVHRYECRMRYDHNYYVKDAVQAHSHFTYNVLL